MTKNNLHMRWFFPGEDALPTASPELQKSSAFICHFILSCSGVQTQDSVTVIKWKRKKKCTSKQTYDSKMRRHHAWMWIESSRWLGTGRWPLSCRLFTVSYRHCFTGVNTRPRSLSFWFENIYGFALGFTSSEHLQMTTLPPLVFRLHDMHMHPIKSDLS